MKDSIEEDEEKAEIDDEFSATEPRRSHQSQSNLLYGRFALAKFLFILGNVAIKLLVHIEKVCMTFDLRGENCFFSYDRKNPN